MNQDPGAWMVIYCYKTDKFLLGKRSNQVRKPRLWDFFGGHLDPGESPEAAVLRELAEETGLTPQDEHVRFLGETDLGALGYANGLRELHYFLLLTDQEVAPRLGPEHTHFHLVQAPGNPQGPQPSFQRGHRDRPRPQGAVAGRANGPALIRGLGPSARGLEPGSCQTLAIPGLGGPAQ